MAEYDIYQYITQVKNKHEIFPEGVKSSLSVDPFLSLASKSSSLMIPHNNKKSLGDIPKFLNTINY